jgi:flagellar motor switch/type III secretory pathway protein FliN
MNAPSIRRARFDRDAVVWRSAASDYVLLAERESTQALALKLLGLPKAKKALRGKDAELFDGLAAACLDQFSQSLSKLLKCDATRAEHDGTLTFAKAMHFDVFFAAGQKIEVFLERDLVTQVRRALLPAPRTTAALETRSFALTETLVDLGAYVGASSIPMGDLNALAPGDVIVTDTPCASPLRATINNHVRAALTCTVQHGSAGPELHFEL